MATLKQDALDYHRRGRPGKISVCPTKPLTTQQHLSLAYTPGVAEACREIHRDPMTIFELTARGNLVAVVSNGSAILGLGNLGPGASKPVMEGKGVLFKRFADVDVFDLELNTSDPQQIICTCKLLEQTFGGINLEDIKAPECFEIEETLVREMSIPVFHDDQHGTAIISAAALINACELTGRKIENVQVVFMGAGAAGIACAKFWASMGVKHENIVMFDIDGVLYEGRENLNKYQAEFATKRDVKTVEEALKGADVLLGVSAAGVIDPDWLKGMAPDPLIFAMANPVPEIMPEEVKAVRPDAIMGTGRSDYPNQVNNVLGFPFIFRGALDVAATVINEEMKLAAAKALADLAHEPVPESVLRAYGVESLEFGRDYLIPKPLDSRVLLWEAPAVAKAAMDSGVAQRQLDLDEYRDMLIARLGPGRLMRNNILNYAKAGRKQRVVYPEGEVPKIIYAAYLVQREGIANPILLGREDVIQAKIQEMALDFDPPIITPHNDTDHEEYSKAYFELRKRKGMTFNVAQRRMRSRTNFGLMMVKLGDADVCVNGLTHDYGQVIRPALEIFKTREGVSKVSGVYLMIAEEKVYIFTDATVNIDPSASCLAEIAILAADFAKTLTIEPRVAMLSYSNFGSTRTGQTGKVREAVEIVRQRRPDILVDGEMQADTAVVPEIVEERFPFSQVKDANVLVFPTLTSANTSYKLLSRLSSVEAIGPILLGLEAPVHVLQAGAEVDDIVAMTAVAVMDAQQRWKR